MKIVITGGAGYVGGALAEKLGFLPEIEEVRIFDNLSSGNYDLFFNGNLNKEKIKFIEGDILETRKLVKTLKGANVVIHLASLDLPGSDDATLHRLEQVNHWGTAELSYALEASDVQKFIFTSTAQVYGFSETVKTETSEPNPETPYALSKLRAELHVMRLHEKMNTIVFRPGVIAGRGPVKNFKGVANKMIFDALIRKRVSIYGDGKQVRPITSLSYLVSALETAIKGNLPSSVYNIAQQNLSVLDILDSVKSTIPDTEFIFTNHHFSLPHISISSDFLHLLPVEDFSLQNEYEQILKYFRI